MRRGDESPSARGSDPANWRRARIHSAGSHCSSLSQAAGIVSISAASHPGTARAASDSGLIAAGVASKRACHPTAASTRRCGGRLRIEPVQPAKVSGDGTGDLPAFAGGEIAARRQFAAEHGVSRRARRHEGENARGAVEGGRNGHQSFTKYRRDGKESARI